MKTRLIVLSAVAAVALSLAASAYAADAPVIFSQSNCGNCNEHNVLFNVVGREGPAHDVAGSTQTNFGSVPVDFTSTSDFLFSSGGQADLDACATGTLPCTAALITNATIDVSTSGGFFQDYILNPTKLAETNDLMVTVDTNMGDAMFGPWGRHLNGQNYLTIRANPGVEHPQSDAYLR